MLVMEKPRRSCRYVVSKGKHMSRPHEQDEEADGEQPELPGELAKLGRSSAGEAVGRSGGRRDRRRLVEAVARRGHGSSRWYPMGVPLAVRGAV